MTGTIITDTKTRYTTYNSRKFSEYAFIEVLCGYRMNNIQVSKMLSYDKFSLEGLEITLSYYSSSQESTQAICVEYIDDTSIYAYKDVGIMNYLEIIGHKFVIE